MITLVLGIIKKVATSQRNIHYRLFSLKFLWTLLFSFMLFFYQRVYGQSFNKRQTKYLEHAPILVKHGQRHVPGIKSFELLVGVSKFDGRLFNIGYVKFISPIVYYKLNAFYANDSDINFRHLSIGIDLTAAYTLWICRGSYSSRENFLYFSALAGITYAYDQFTSKSEGLFFDYLTQKTPKYGVFFGVEAETFLNNNFSVIANFTQRYLFNNLPTEILENNQGKLRWYATVGLRYHLFNEYLACRKIPSNKIVK